MFTKLLERLSKIKVVESGNLLVPNASAIAHNPKYKLGVWWYDIVNMNLLFDPTATHAQFEKFPGLKDNDGTSIWIKGRVFKYTGFNYIFVYTDDFKERKIRLSGQILANIVQKVQDLANVSINKVVDEVGHVLYQE